MSGGTSWQDVLRELSALRRDLDKLDRRTGQITDAGDEMGSELLAQVVAIEEVLAAPWWRRRRAAARWRREVRESIAAIEGADWIDKRLNTLGTGWVSRPGSRHHARAQWTGPGEDRDAG